jgi:hypothetical protein
MIVAMVAVRMMQAPANDVVHVVSVGDGLVPAVWAVHMAARLAVGDAPLAAVGVGLADLDHVLIVVHLAIHLVRVVQMAVMQVVEVVTMADGLVTAAGAVFVVVI